MFRIIRTAVLLSCCWSAPAGAEPFSVHTMLAVDRIGDPVVSPDGRSIVFVRRTTDLKANRGRTDLWRVGVDGQGLRRLTTHEAGDQQPRWSPDGRSIYFLSSRSGSSQVWRIAADGGEAEQVTDQPLDIGSFALAPDGMTLAISMDVFPGSTPEQTKARLSAVDDDPSTGQLYEKLFVRHWDTWADGRRSHLFVLPLSGGAAVDIMGTMDADCPTKPFGGPEDYAFTPDSQAVVFTARLAGAAEAWSTDFDLYVAAREGTTPPTCLTEDNAAWDANPVFSPDGKTLAYLAMARPGYEADRFVIMVRAWPDGSPRPLTAEWDRSPSTLAWSADGRELLCTAQHLGQRVLFAVDALGKVRTIVGEGTVSFPQPSAAGIIFGLDHLHSPVELHAVNSDGSGLRPITALNQEIMAATAMGGAEQFTFDGWNDEAVHAYVIEPVGLDPQRRYPVAMLIHGGPQGSFGNHFHYRWNPQAYAGAGYAVLCIDFHGSTGYGQAFTDSIRMDWGGKPLVDLQKGLSAALERYPWMDGERVAALGASYGGYMINWIAGQWPDRFRCLVNHDGGFDSRFFYYDTEELWFPEWENGGTPWENSAGYSRQNPVDYVHLWKTPMLVIHGALDFRITASHGLAAFTALQRRGVPSQLLYFPDENHWVLKPANSIQWHDTVLAWLGRFTSAPTGPDPRE